MPLIARLLTLVLMASLAACQTIRRSESLPVEPEPVALPAPPKLVTPTKQLSGTIAQLRLRASESELAALARLETELRLLSQLIDEAERAGRPSGQFAYARLRAELDGLRAGIRAYRVSEWQQPREIEAMALESIR